MVALPRSRLLALVRSLPVILPLAVLAGMIVLNPTLRKWSVWENICRGWSAYAILAMGLTPVIVAGGIDLSVGAVAGLSAVTIGALWQYLGWPLPVAIVTGVAAGTVAGVLNGLIILSGVHPLIVTLATMAVFRGLAHGLSGTSPVRNFPDSFEAWWSGDVFGIPHPAAMIFIVFMSIYTGLHHTWMGRMLYAMGDNWDAARLATVPTKALTVAIYALSGCCSGLAGLTGVAEYDAAVPHYGEGFELTAIACVVLGGVRITGASGHLTGTLLGTVTLAALLEGMYRIQSQWRPLLSGLFLIVIAVANEALGRWRFLVELRCAVPARPEPPSANDLSAGSA